MNPDLGRKLRTDFPILDQNVNGHPLIFLDNAASTQKPKMVIDAISNYYSKDHANIHRGVHCLSQRASDQYENARAKVAQFLNAPSSDEIIFTRGTTEAINLVAASFGEKFINEGDIILLSELEHHSNIVPWQMLASRKNAVIKVIPMLDDGSLNMDAFKTLLESKPTLVSVNHISNSLGTINPVEEIIRASHEAGAKVLIDGAQSVQHLGVDVQALDCDFFCFSGHKIYGPTGVGVLYGKRELLNEMPPYQGGGDMIKEVRFDHTEYNELPFKFEAGTPNIVGAIGLHAALDYIEEIGLDEIASYEAALLSYMSEKLEAIEGLNFIGTAEYKSSVVSFTLDRIHPYDAGVLLDKFGVAVRTGHHCTQPVMQHFGIPGTCRASLALYNTFEEIDAFILALNKIIVMLR